MLNIEPAAALVGTAAVPGDKSISHRAVILGSIAGGETEITGFLAGADCLDTVRAMRALGVQIENIGPTHLRIQGRGTGLLSEPADIIDVGNSGTTMRLLAGLLSGMPFFSVLSGDASIRSRPMDRVTIPLGQMGAVITGRAGGLLAPLAIKGGNLRPIVYESPVASAQVKSAVLLAALSAAGDTSVTEPHRSRDHTERMLAGFGARITVSGRRVTLTGGAPLRGQRVAVPGDISSAAFLMVAAGIVAGSEICIKNIGVNPTRSGIVDVLKAMGATVELHNQSETAGEPVADVIVRYTGGLQATEIGGDLIPRLIDEIPVLAVAACAAEGTTVIRDAEELRVKESDRISTTVTELRKLGARIEERPDGMVIHGGRPLAGAAVDAHGDHRLAMALAVAGLAARGGVRIAGAQAIDVSFPGFAAVLEQLARR